MCGIVGILNTDQSPVLPETIERMTHSLSHRGPDGWGIEVRDGAAIGHRRLSIIDLEGGRQPLANEDGQVWVTFNGEIYNFLDLRNELEDKGHVFRTHSDTEVIVHAYEAWGDDCVTRFRGMFAFGILDLRLRRIFLARDHLGIKPLYYLHSNRRFAFSSELQALKVIPGQAFTLDLQAIDEYLWLQYIPAPLTAFQEVRKLPPGHHVSITFEGRFFGPKEYWQLEFRPQRRRSQAEWLEEAEECLADSVHAHLVSDVPFGAFLSGGVDSSMIVAYMAQIMKQPVRTFSIGFEEEEFSELDYARQVSQRWATEHHTEIVKPDAMAVLPSLVRHYGEPFGDSSAIPTFYVCQMARTAVPMVLSGDGGDEMFAGYDSYCSWMRWLSGDGRPAWKRWLHPLARAVAPRRYPKWEVSVDNWLRFINYMRVSQRRSLWRQEYRSVCDAPVAAFEREFARTQGYSPCHTVQYMDLKTYLPYDILTKVDIAAMMHGLEVRTPIVDVRVVEFAATIPESFNMCRDAGGRWTGKSLLKQIIKKYYPTEFCDRPKQGFAVPLQRWFAPNGALRGELDERLCGPDSILQTLFRPKAIRALLDESVVGPLWLLLFLDEWLRQNKTMLSW